MMNRREFVTIGAATVAGAGMMGTALASAPFATDRAVSFLLPYRVLFDERFVDGQLFARQAGRLGATAVGIRGDVAAVWYDELRPRCEQGAVALAGLTTRSALFCIEQLASNHWMSLRFRTEHHPVNDSVLEHRLRGPQHMLNRATGLLRASTDWRVQMADVVTQCPLESAATAQCTLVTRAELPDSNRESLVSWIIATHDIGRKA